MRLNFAYYPTKIQHMVVSGWFVKVMSATHTHGIVLVTAEESSYPLFVFVNNNWDKMTTLFLPEWV